MESEATMNAARNYEPWAPSNDAPRDARESAAQLSEAAVADAISTVYDPEIPVNILELGLVYDITLGPEGKVEIVMTLTSPACPVAQDMPDMVAEAVRMVAGVGEVVVDITWDPPWTPDMMSEAARLELGFF